MANEMISLITELKEFERMKEELEAEIESRKDAIKAAMGSDEVLVAGPYKVTWKSVTSNRLDTTAMKKAMPADVLAPYMVSSTTRRFVVN